MTASRARALSLTDWGRISIADQAPLRRYPTKTERPRTGEMLARLREIVQRIQGKRRRKPTAGPPGPPKEPPQRLERESYWDDPALWMLMMH
jgi:hypothetical protein